MQQFHFEYTKSNVLITVVITGFILGGIAGYILPDLGLIFGLNIRALISLLIWILSIVLNISRFKKSGEALLKENVLELKLDGVITIIPFDSIKSYKIEYGNGTVLYLRFHNQPKISISANDKFCNSELFYEFCIELEKQLIVFGKSDKAIIERKPSIFENKWMFLLIAISTVIFFVIIIRASYLGHKIERQTLSGFAALGLFWSAWFLAWIKKKRLNQL